MNVFDKFEFVEGGMPYVVTKGTSVYTASYANGGACSYPINDNPENWIHQMIKKHLKEPANGVNAEGQPLDFTNAMMKPFMRVIRREGTVGIAISSPQDGLVIVGKFQNGCSWTSGQDYLNTLETYSDIMAVYEAPSNPGHLINKELKGDLIWKRVEKTAEQLAQEAAKAARDVLIEEAEKALKSAQDKLAALKNI